MRRSQLNHLYATTSTHVCFCLTTKGFSFQKKDLRYASAVHDN